jgi:hypothetical protein
VYYAITLGLISLSVWRLGGGSFAIAPTSAPSVAGGAPAPVDSLHMLARACLAIFAAFLLSLPIAFAYVRTRSRLDYDRNVVQSVIMLPVVVAAILVVVQNSLALAFSLTGIVAAVRFRNNLEDARDAVYILVAVAIGFAAGVRQSPIASLLSVVFVVLELLIWKFDLTGEHERTFGLLCESSHPPAEVAAAAAVNETPDHRHLLRLYAREDPRVDAKIERVLDRTTRKWKRIDKRPGGLDQRVLDYQIRLEADQLPTTVIDALYAESGKGLIAAEVVTPGRRRP